MKDLEAIREQFPILATRVRGKPLAYLDNAATSQKPRSVLEAMDVFYRTQNANVRRGAHYLGEQTTVAYEQARMTVGRFLNAYSASEIIFTRNATEAINLVAMSWARAQLHPGDEIILTQAEHHANIVPWQLIAEPRKVVIRVAPITDNGALDLEAFKALLGPKTKLVAMTAASNVLGTIFPVKECIEAAHAVGARVLIDASQAAPHYELNVQALDVDFLVFTAHKIFGPMGIGVLYGKKSVLASMPPYQGGGDMVERVSFAKTSFREAPARFEAGTPNVAGAIGLVAALNFLNSLDRIAVEAHEQDLLEMATQGLQAIAGVHIQGEALAKIPVISFTLEGVHPHDMATVFDSEGIAIRAGHHCAQPLMDYLGLVATARVSFALYNTREEVQRFLDTVHKIKKFFR